MMAGMENDPAIGIRPARTGETSAIRDLVRRAYAMYVPRIGKEPGPVLDDYDKRVADGSVFVLEAKGRLAGILVLLPYEDHLLLDNVAVETDFQGRGIGKALVAFAEHEAVRRGYDEIRLYTHQTMTENIRMYAALGYEESGRGEQAGYDRVFMRKLL